MEGFSAKLFEHIFGSGASISGAVDCNGLVADSKSREDCGSCKLTEQEVDPDSTLCPNSTAAQQVFERVHATLDLDTKHSKETFRKSSICSVDSACVQMEELTLCGKCATCTLVKTNSMHKSSLPQFDPIAVSQHMFHCTWMCSSFCFDTQTNFTMNSIRQHTDPHDNFSAMFTLPVVHR